MIDWQKRYILMSELAEECCLSITALKKFINKHCPGIEGKLRRIGTKKYLTYTNTEAKKIFDKHEGADAQPWRKTSWWPTKEELIPRSLWTDEDNKEDVWTT